MVRACQIVTERDWHCYFGLVWTKFDGNSYLGPILKSSVLDYRRQIKPGQFYTAIHLTIWAVQNGPGMLNRNKTVLTLIFWTDLDQVRWKLVIRTDFEKLSLDYRRQLKPGPFCTTLMCRMVRPCGNGPGNKIRIWTGMGFLFWTVLDQTRHKLVFRTDIEGDNGQ